MKIEDIEFHDMPVSTIQLDFDYKTLTIGIPIFDEYPEKVPQKIIFKGIKEIENTGIPSINSECEIYSLDINEGNELQHSVELIMLTG